MKFDTLSSIVPSEYAGQICKHVNHVIHGMLGHAALTEADREDLEQSLLLRLSSAFKKYDPAKSNPATFASRIIDRWRASVYINRIRKKLDEFPDQFDEALNSEKTFVADWQQFEDNCDRLIRILETREVIDALPEHLQKFCEAFMKTGTLRGAAKLLGIKSKSYLENYILPSLRTAFSEVKHEI